MSPEGLCKVVRWIIVFDRHISKLLWDKVTVNWFGKGLFARCLQVVVKYRGEFNVEMLMSCHWWLVIFNGIDGKYMVHTVRYQLEKNYPHDDNMNERFDNNPEDTIFLCQAPHALHPRRSCGCWFTNSWIQQVMEVHGNGDSVIVGEATRYK